MPTKKPLIKRKRATVSTLPKLRQNKAAKPVKDLLWERQYEAYRKSWTHAFRYYFSIPTSRAYIEAWAEQRGIK